MSVNEKFQLEVCFDVVYVLVLFVYCLELLEGWIGFLKYKKC